MAGAASPDHLFGLRNSFYVGAYQAVITGVQAIPARAALSPDALAERDSLLYRSYIAIGSHQVRTHRVHVSIDRLITPCVLDEKIGVISSSNRVSLKYY